MQKKTQIIYQKTKNKHRLITNPKAAPRRRRLSRRPVRRRKYIFVADFCQHFLLVLVQQPLKLFDWCSLMSILCHVLLVFFFAAHNYKYFCRCPIFLFFSQKIKPYFWFLYFVHLSKFSICVVFPIFVVNVCKSTNRKKKQKLLLKLENFW